MNSSDAVLLIDSECRIAQVNHTAEKLFGISNKEVVGLGAEILIPEEARAAHIVYFRNFVRTRNFPMKMMQGREVEFSRSDGTKFFGLLSISTSGQGEDFLLAAFIRDVTAMHQRNANSDALLQNMLPKGVADRLVKNPLEQITETRTVSILFSDIVGFTEMCSSTSNQQEMVKLLCALFAKWEELLEQYGLEKIKTMGDGFMACGGDPVTMTNHAEKVTLFAMDMLKSLEEFNEEHGTNWRVRIGINTGVAVAGVFGKTRMVYDLFGDEVNMASRMESTGVAGGVHVSEKTFRLLKEKIRILFTERTEQVKGKGETTTYLYIPPTDGAF